MVDLDLYFLWEDIITTHRIIILFMDIMVGHDLRHVPILLPDLVPVMPEALAEAVGEADLKAAVVLEAAAVVAVLAESAKKRSSTFVLLLF